MLPSLLQKGCLKPLQILTKAIADGRSFEGQLSMAILLNQDWQMSGRMRGRQFYGLVNLARVIRRLWPGLLIRRAGAVFILNLKRWPDRLFCALTRTPGRRSGRTGMTGRSKPRGFIRDHVRLRPLLASMFTLLDRAVWSDV